MDGDATAAPQAATGRTAGEQPGEDAEAVRRRSARMVGVGAYLACVRVGDRETAGRIAGEMQALGLAGPDCRPVEDVTGGDALKALRQDWGHAYAIGRDGDRRWWAARKSGAWEIFTALSPDALRTAMAEDYGLVSQ